MFSWPLRLCMEKVPVEWFPSGVVPVPICGVLYSSDLGFVALFRKDRIDLPRSVGPGLAVEWIKPDPLFVPFFFKSGTQDWNRPPFGRSDQVWPWSRSIPIGCSSLSFSSQVPRTGLTSLRSVGPGLAVEWIKPDAAARPLGFSVPILAQAVLGSAGHEKAPPLRGRA